ncbi:Sugar transporter, conserved site,Major facilitator superfamily domain,Major facilitator, sugar [Cinara cedri]|uniref:Sugar transporter, conserved site,Major facilitator superfamily domain,Major facilitator, sugar n=1 Tax=Cinara cedri TaxID=506608 RepID=A0A5E4NQE5_9HEMI|nr:Sugar transporter, conserved site,Major facilitator superfamily domain,Major facilitator, sugar [Cinara cedri]
MVIQANVSASAHIKKSKLITLIYNLSGGTINAQIIITVIATLGAVANGTILGWSSPAQVMLESENQVSFPVTDKDTQTFSSVFGIGAALGALPAGYVSGLFGRRTSMMLFEGFLLVGWIILVYPTSVWMLSVGRVLQGIGAGALCAIIPSYVGEIAEPQMRGRLGTVFQFLIVAGILFSYTFGAFLKYVPFCLLCAVWVLLHLLGALCIPESPYYLMGKNHPERAAASLQTLRGSSDTTEELAAIKDFIEQQKAQSYTISEVLSDKTNRKALLISIGCMFFQQMSGINVVIFYMTDIFESTGSNISPNACTITVGIVQLIMTMVSLSIIDKSGRKLLLVISSLLMAVCYAGLGGFYLIKKYNSTLAKDLYWLPLLCIAVYISAFSIGSGPVPWVLMGEIFSSEVKPIGTSLTTCTNWTLVFVVTYVSNELTHWLGSSGCFLTFSAFCLMGAVFAMVIVPETKNKSLAEIQLRLVGKRAAAPRAAVSSIAMTETTTQLPTVVTDLPTVATDLPTVVTDSPTVVTEEAKVQETSEIP